MKVQYILNVSLSLALCMFAKTVLFERKTGPRFYSDWPLLDMVNRAAPSAPLLCLQSLLSLATLHINSVQKPGVLGGHKTPQRRHCLLSLGLELIIKHPPPRLCCNRLAERRLSFFSPGALMIRSASATWTRSILSATIHFFFGKNLM